MSADQYYLFTVPGDMCEVWAEFYGTDGTHVVAPTPYAALALAEKCLRGMHPGAVVDQLDDPQEPAEVRGWARTHPLEQIGGAK